MNRSGECMRFRSGNGETGNGTDIMGTGDQRDLTRQTDIVEETTNTGVLDDATLEIVRKLVADETGTSPTNSQQRTSNEPRYQEGQGIKFLISAPLRRLSFCLRPRRLTAARAVPPCEGEARRTLSLTPRMMVPAIFAAVILIEPLLIPGLSLFFLTMVTIVYFSLGPDRVTELVLDRYQRINQRDPEKAMRLRNGAAQMSARAAVWIDRLPPRWTRGLYLPDFEDEPKPHEKLSTDPFDRLASDARNI